MSAARAFRPSQKLERKYRVTVWLVFLLTIFPFVFLGLVPELGWTYVGIFLAANAVWLVPTLLLMGPYYRSIQYELGEEEVIARRGILTKTVDTVPYRTVTNISLKRGPLDRWLGIGGLVIHTAGYSAQATAEACLVGLEDYDRVHHELLAALRRYRARTGPAIGAEEQPLAEGNATALLQQILNELQALRQMLGKREG
jgi:membrane protein YdbS with pleckstrin-like domain